jgi:hypothetical protein
MLTRVQRPAIFRREALRAAIFCAAATLASIALPLSSAAAQDAGKVVEAIAPEVSEVVSGGQWSAEGKGGFYRVLVIITGDKAASAHVFLQWLAFGDAQVPTIVRSVPVKEINDRKLENASVQIGGEQDEENKTTIVVSSYDIDEDEDISLYITATQPGTYTVEKGGA